MVQSRPLAPFLEHHVPDSRNGEVAVISEADQFSGRQDLPAGIAVVSPEGFRFFGVVHGDQDAGLAVRSLIS